MRGFEISRNDVRLCVAAVQQDESLTVIIAHSPDGEFINVSGNVGLGDTFPHWVETLSLEVGDEILIKVVDAKQSDVPARVLSRKDLWPAKE